MLYLTGATSSVTQSEVHQDDPMKSLGGYISSSPVPNGALNSLFDLVSMKTIKDKTKETIAIGLVNKFDKAVTDVSAKIVANRKDICRFKIAAVSVDDKFCMEHINNRYAEPMGAEFYDVTFFRASVDVEILHYGISGEEISFEPFDVIATVEESGIEGTYNAIEKAFSNSEIYRVIRLSENTFRVERKDEEALDKPLPCSFIATDEADFKFIGDFKNEENNEVLIADELQPNQAIGIWIQREVSESAEKSNEELIEDYNNGIKSETIEEVELIINYNIFEETDSDNGDSETE